MDLEVTLQVIDYAVLFSGEVDLEIIEPIPMSITFNGEAFLDVSSSANFVNASLPALGGTAFESASGYGAITAYMPALTVSAEGISYVPPATEDVFALLPPLTAEVRVGTSSPVSIAGVMPALVAGIYESDYGAITADLPVLLGGAIEDPNPGEGVCFNVMYLLDGAISMQEHVIVVLENGQIADTITCTREAVADILNTLNLSGTITSIGTFSASILANLSGIDSITSSIGTGATFAPSVSGQVWVVNLDTGATSQYDDYGFNSFFERDGEYYGVADDGIYKLDGDDDAGIDIDAMIDFGNSDYGTYQPKKSMGCYIGISSEGKLYLRTTVDGVERTYQMRKNSTAMKTHKIPISHTQTGTYWDFVLLNENGEDFEIANIDFKLFPFTRRVM